MYSTVSFTSSYLHRQSFMYPVWRELYHPILDAESVAVFVECSLFSASFADVWNHVPVLRCGWTMWVIVGCWLWLSVSYWDQGWGAPENTNQHSTLSSSCGDYCYVFCVCLDMNWGWNGSKCEKHTKNRRNNGNPPWIDNVFMMRSWIGHTGW